MGGSFLPDAVPNVPEHSLSASVLSIAFLVKLHIFFISFFSASHYQSVKNSVSKKHVVG